MLCQPESCRVAPLARRASQKGCRRHADVLYEIVESLGSRGTGRWPRIMSAGRAGAGWNPAPPSWRPDIFIEGAGGARFKAGVQALMQSERVEPLSSGLRSSDRAPPLRRGAGRDALWPCSAAPCQAGMAGCAKIAAGGRRASGSPANWGRKPAGCRRGAGGRVDPVARAERGPGARSPCSHFVLTLNAAPCYWPVQPAATEQLVRSPADTSSGWPVLGPPAGLPASAAPITNIMARPRGVD